MKLIKSQPRYKCDFCKKRSTKSAIEAHEKICFRNPNRFCELCKNKGYYTECYGDLIEDGDCGLSENIPCPYCSKFDKKILKEIEEREEKLLQEAKLKWIKNNPEDILKRSLKNIN